MPTLDFDFVTVTADLIPETLEAIKAGSVTAAIGQHPYLQGYMPIHDMAQHVLNEKPLPSGYVYLPVEIVNAENIETVVARQSDVKVQYEWYKKYISENIDTLEGNVVPFND